MEGYLVAPGYIDLSKLKFTAVDVGTFVVDDDEFEAFDDIFDGDNDDDSLNGVDGDDGLPRMRHERHLQDEYGDDEVDVTAGSSLDIAVFQLVSLGWDAKQRDHLFS